MVYQLNSYTCTGTVLEKEFWYGGVSEGISSLHLVIGHYLMSHMSPNLNNTDDYGYSTVVII